MGCDLVNVEGNTAQGNTHKHTLVRPVNNTQLTTDQCGQELSMDDLSTVYGGGPIAVAGWIALNAFTLAIPAMVDLANGSPYASEAINSKF